jgi:signal transduction histidine kinase
MTILEIIIKIEPLLISFIALGSLFLSLLVYYRDKKNLRNKYFAYVSLLLGGVLLSSYISEFFPRTHPKLAILFSKLSYSTGIFWALFFFFFSTTFLGKIKLSLGMRKLTFLFSSFLALLTFFTPLTIKGIKITSYGFDIIYGPLFYLFILSVLIFIILSLANYVSAYKNVNSPERDLIQLRYLSIGFGIFITMGFLFGVILPRTIGEEAILYRFGNYSSIFFIALTTYAIVAKRLFGIEVILTEILVGVIGILLVVQIFTAPTTLWRIVNGIIFVLFCVFGYLLIRGVFREIRRREELEKISQAKSEFISITSHQLRTPLSAIKGYLSMVLEGTYGGISERVKKVIENVYTANERLIKLVNSFLDVSRIELGREELKLERISIEDLISETVSEMEIEARKKNLYLKFERPKIALPKILIDRGRIKEVISNLIDNAIKYTQKGGITIKSQISNGKCQISISDTGEGLTKEEISRLFESFSRGTAGAKFWTEGVGLGLYVSKKFVELHGGKIWAESEGKGKGSTFYIELPIK